MTYNLLDVLLLVALVSAAIRGYRQGALAQVATFGGAAAGLLFGATLAPRISAEFVDQPGTDLALITFVVLLAFILLGQTIGVAVGNRMQAAAHSAGVGGVDRGAGIAVGLISLLLVVWLLASALVQGPVPVIAQQVRESRIVTALGQSLPQAPNLFGQVGNYLQEQGFPQVFSGIGGGATAPPVDPPSDAAVAAAQQAAAGSTVQVQSLGCDGISSGSGFVTAPGFVVTNAHVIAGGEVLNVRDQAGTHDATAILFDPELDLAVLSAPGAAAPPIGFVSTPAERGTAGATLGYPGGQQQQVVKPAAVRARGEAVGRDIYGRGLVPRDILTLSAPVQQGDSGGPFVTSDGLVGGLVFAAASAEPGTGYALTAERVAPDVQTAIAANSPVGTGECRF